MFPAWLILIWFGVGVAGAVCTNAPENAVYVVDTSGDGNNCAWECRAGYYGSSANGDTACEDCGNGYYCTGGAQRVSCSTTIRADAPMPDNVFSVSTGFDNAFFDRNHATRALDCYCDWYLSDETRTSYLKENSCMYGPASHDYTAYTDCRTGYYAAEPLGWGKWYTACRPCTNKPENSTYTSYATPSVMYAVEDNCPWECDVGYGRTPQGECRPLCDAGITKIHTGAIEIPLFASPHTSPAINVRIPGGTVCFGGLVAGAASGAMNIRVGDTVYHTVRR